MLDGQGLKAPPMINQYFLEMPVESLGMILIHCMTNYPGAEMTEDEKKMAEFAETLRKSGAVEAMKSLQPQTKPFNIASLGVTPDEIAAAKIHKMNQAIYGTPMPHKAHEIDQRLADHANRLSAAQHARDNPVLAVFKELQSYIEEFEGSLNADEEVGAQLVTFGQDVKFHIKNVGYAMPSLIHFDGVLENGSRVRLVQNVTQLSVLFIAMPLKAGEERRPIGFVYPENSEE
jgi:hypothetical protein